MAGNKITKGQLLGGLLKSQTAVASGSQGFTSASVALRMIRIAVSCATTGERDTGYALPVGSVVKAVYLDVNTREQTATTKTIDVGLLSTQTGGDADGFLVGASTASVQVVQASMVAGSKTRGALLVEGTAASQLFTKFHVVQGANATNISTQVAEVQTELAADLIIEYLAVG